jgi:hypothetical protein
MKYKIFFLILFMVSKVWSQDGFKFEKNRKCISIPFKLINNLVFIPVELNGIQLTFLVDTGVEETILFSLEDVDNVSLENIKKIKLRGLGTKEPFDGLKSSNNKLKIKNFIDKDHDVYVVLDQDINISSSVGIPVNGILGYHFFKNNPILIDYIKKKIIVYKEVNSIKRINSYDVNDIELQDNKPYILTNIQTTINSSIKNSKLLIDSGNSDAVWIFNSSKNELPLPEINIDDFLGKGFSGNIYGKRARIEAFSINKYNLKKVITSFPDSLTTKDIEFVDNRVGSIGGEILKRFKTIFDYKNKKIYIKKNQYFDEEFNINMTGIDIQHEGLQWVEDFSQENAIFSNEKYDINGNNIGSNFKFKFKLKPSYAIFNIRKNSPAENAGLQVGDKIIKINSRFAYDMTLSAINDLFKSQENKEILIEIERNNKKIKVYFLLKKML